MDQWKVFGMKRIKYIVISGMICVLMASCTVKNAFRGEYYLGRKDYKGGILALEKDLAAAPDSHQLHYYLGRFYLADMKYGKGLSHMLNAVKLAPQKADYHFWLGVAYSAHKNKEKEKQSYEAALKKDARHLKARLYLAHVLLDQKNYKKALINYEHVLKWAPNEPAALYNRALILERTGRKKEARDAWKAYLAEYLHSGMAPFAVTHLNDAGNFDYRNHLIGVRTIALNDIRFDDVSLDLTKQSKSSLSFLGKILSEAGNVSIHIIAYQKNNPELAEKKAKTVKKYLLMMFSGVDSQRLKVSWFGTSEKIKIKKQVYRRDESIRFITAI